MGRLGNPRPIMVIMVGNGNQIIKGGPLGYIEQRSLAGAYDEGGSPLWKVTLVISLVPR